MSKIYKDIKFGDRRIIFINGNMSSVAESQKINQSYFHAGGIAKGRISFRDKKIINQYLNF